MMTFSEVLSVIESGGKFRRRHWPEKDQYVTFNRLKEPDAVVNSPYIYIKTFYKTFPWTPNQDDLFAKDWVWVN